MILLRPTPLRGRHILDIDAPDRFVAGSAGEADDEEELYLQAIRGARSVTVALEREQVALLSHRMLLILGELERRGLLAIEAAAASPDEGRLLEPFQVEFRAGTLTIGWDNDSSRVVVEVFAMVFDAGAGESALTPDTEPDEEEVADDDPLGPDLLRVRLTPSMALGFARQAGRLTS
jgi:uncharacterized repeat protein (TIGR03847 family)